MPPELRADTPLGQLSPCSFLVIFFILWSNPKNFRNLQIAMFQENMLLHNIQKKSSVLSNMEFHITIKKQIIILWILWQHKISFKSFCLSPF